MPLSRNRATRLKALVLRLRQLRLADGYDDLPLASSALWSRLARARRRRAIRSTVRRIALLADTHRSAGTPGAIGFNSTSTTPILTRIGCNWDGGLAGKPLCTASVDECTECEWRGRNRPEDPCNKCGGPVIVRPCRCYAMLGTDVCRSHGGLTAALPRREGDRWVWGNHHRERQQHGEWWVLTGVPTGTWVRRFLDGRPAGGWRLVRDADPEPAAT